MMNAQGPPPPSAPRAVADRAAVDLLEGMVSIESLSGREGVVAAHIVRRMAELGLDASIDEAGNAVGATRPAECTTDRGGPIDIVLLGHMDTVPGRVRVRREGDLLFGRGSVDAKGPLAAFIAAAAAVGLPPGVRLIVIGAVEEEAATSRGARHAAAGWRPSACVIGEPSGWDGVTLGYKGRLLLEYTRSRACAHSAGPGPTVGEDAAAWWESVRRYAAEHGPTEGGAFELIQASLRSINTASDGLHDHVRATVGLRLPPGLDPSDAERACRAGVGEGSIVARGHESAFVGDRHSPLVRALTSSIRDHGAKPRLLVKTGTSDMNVVGPAWRCPIVAYGPGDSALDHTPDEHISISEYLRSIGVLRAALERIARDLAAERAGAARPEPREIPPTSAPAS